jgi:CMP-N-acetylneuraminic acid synthetase
MNQNIVFLPCRKGSQRVPNKNTRPFAGVDGGLLRIKLEELLKAKLIDKIILSSNDAEVLQIGKEFNHPKL